MKQKFSTKWKASKQPRKQRKYLANAPLHLKRKFLGANLNKELRKKYGMRSVEIRKGDEIEIMRGKMKKKKGKITEINMKNMKVAVENLQVTKKEGTKVNIWFAPSNLRIFKLKDEDAKRFKRIKKEAKKDVKEEKTVEKKEVKTEIKKIKTGDKDAHKKK